MTFTKLAVAILVVVAVVSAEEFVIEGIRVTDWGTWGQMELCDKGDYVYGMRLKVEEDQGFFSDDSALGGVQLLCISPTAKRPMRNASIEEFKVISSIEGHKGSHGPIVECPEPDFAIGFQMRSEDNQGAVADDTAANNMRLVCQSGETLEGNGRDWGSWTFEVRCPRGLRICGIQTQVEGSTSDDTTLNNVNMGCCV